MQGLLLTALPALRGQSLTNPSPVDHRIVVAAQCGWSRWASPGLRIVTLHCWRAEKRICCVQDSGACPMGRECALAARQPVPQAGSGEHG